mgnify:CR=1 FL=1
MPAYLIESGRSYENPIDSYDFQRTYTSADHPSFGNITDPNMTNNAYQIRVDGSGPGSLAFGKDEVYYIGTQSETCVANCDSERRETYRFYSGRRLDHVYYYDQELPDNLPLNPRRYNKEPRSGRQVFYLQRENLTNTTAVYLHYDSSNFNSYFSSSSSGAVALLGYIWSNATDPVNHSNGSVLNSGENMLPLYHYRATGDPRGTDDFYTTDPANESNLQIGVAGVPDSTNPLEQQYQYIGIYGYVFGSKAPRRKKQVIETGKPINTGEVSRAGWYDWDSDSGYGEEQYNQQSPPASTLGWGNPDNVDLLDDKANFEWFYGKNGAVKACLPKFLGFHDAFEGQFVYYLYDTSFPFSGPIYGINLITTDAPCNPSTADCPHDPHTLYHSYYYEMRQDAWQTKKTRLVVDAPPGSGMAESFWTVGTDDFMVFFRYTSNTGFFAVGETLNGWKCQSVRYFGDELKCGYIRLQPTNGVKGSAFTYQGVFTSNNGGVAEILAGYGIVDKAAFFGVYEFPKKLAYVKIEVDNEALIPGRNLDLAILEATVNDQGGIGSIEIINSGKDYVDPIINISIPEVMRIEGFLDTAPGTNETFTDSYTTQHQVNHQSEDGIAGPGQATHKAVKAMEKSQFTSDAGYSGTVKQARANIVLDALGSVAAVTIIDPGSGYRPGEKVQIDVVQRKMQEDEVVFFGGGSGTDEISIKTEEASANNNTEISDVMSEASKTLKTTLKDNDFNFSGSTKDEGYYGYITMNDINAEEKTKFCGDQLPIACFSPDIGKDWMNLGTYMDPSEFGSDIKRYGDPRWEQNDDFLSRTVVNSQADAAQIESNYSNGQFGLQGGDCEEVMQANLYQARRFFDIPCPYVAYDQAGTLKTYGYMPYKYCASQEESAVVTVSMHIEGDVSKKGEVINQKFLDWLESLPKPTETRPRPAGPNNRSHACTRGTNVKGRCFSAGNGTFSFAPEAGDENTFDFVGTELEKLATWVGPGNYNSYGTGTVEITDTMLSPPNDTYTHTYNTIQFATCTNGKFPNPCWHNFIADGVLDVYSGYDANGNGLASDDICTGQPFSDPSTWVQSSTLNSYGECAALQNIVHSTVAFDTGKTSEFNPYIELGPITGKMHWVNNLTGSARLLDDSLNRYGNPYFEECDLTDDVNGY